MRTVIPANARLIPPEAKQVFKGIIYDVYHWEQRRFDGSYTTFEMLKRPDTVRVLAVKDDKIVTVVDEQPGRAPVRTLPGGRNDIAAETELQCAQRELLEETGMTFGSWRLIEAVQPHNKIEAFVYIFLAMDFEYQQSPHLDIGEKIAVELMDFSDLLALVNAESTPYLPFDVLRRAGSLQGLIEMPAYGLV